MLIYCSLIRSSSEFDNGHVRMDRSRCFIHLTFLILSTIITCHADMLRNTARRCRYPIFRNPSPPYSDSPICFSQSSVFPNRAIRHDIGAFTKSKFATSIPRWYHGSLAGSSDTIYALSTGTGRAAIAVIRISGPLCIQVCIELPCNVVPNELKA